LYILRREYVVVINIILAVVVEGVLKFLSEWVICKFISLSYYRKNNYFIHQCGERNRKLDLVWVAPLEVTAVPQDNSDTP
jgi:hypothetical protein